MADTVITSSRAGGKTITYEMIKEAAESLRIHNSEPVDWEAVSTAWKDIPRYAEEPPKFRTSSYTGTGTGRPSLILYDDIIRNSNPQKLEDIFEARRLMHELYTAHPEMFKKFAPVDLSNYKPPLIY